MANDLRERIIRSVEDQLIDLKKIKKYIYDHPEIGGTEEKSSRILISYLKDHGFVVTENFCNIPWAFKAVYDSRKPGVSLGMTAEYDALPEIGHACGHNIIATAPTGAAVALKETVDSFGGKVILFGTPAEENLDRKLDMIDAGAFEEVDVCLNIHPYGESMMPMTSTAFDSWQIDFFGRAAHAAIHPEDGINALDTAVDFYQMVNREKLLVDGLNLYGIISEGGVKYSIIPDHTVVKFAARAYSLAPIRAAEEIIKSSAEAACAMNGATFTIKQDEAANLPLNTNWAIANVFSEIYESLSHAPMPPGEFKASLDLGDVSWRVPTIMACVGVGCPGTDLHTTDFREACMTEAGDKAMEWSADALAMTGLQIMEDPELLRKIRREFVKSLVK